ncbi:hypothetical protein FB561_6792 [Kribbella amoyensis]|uniref:Uncharacterized protein n=1 Tax=Kribbella amoyensis TaxID=996641 RepID=A0A561B8R7_9ACTN|nr:hypothetical protein [Kribbella amoyensis]TWD75354.1 hypothetical protein FB561_6792 [Kribbella amoyensis]
MADRPDLGSALDQAAADDSITPARHQVVDPVPIVTDGPELATLESRDSGQDRPAAGVRRRLAPRPVPGNRRRKPVPQVTETDEEPTPAEEMDDVGTHDDKAAKATDGDAEQAATPAGAEQTAGGGATATKAKPQTAAEIVAAQRAREAAAKSAGADDTAVTRTVTRPKTDASSNKAAEDKPIGANPLAAAKAAREGQGSTAGKGSTTGKGSAGQPKGKAALSTVGSGVKRLRNLIASLIWLLAVLAAAVLALGALFTALDQTNQSNEIVRWVLERGQDLVGPFKDLFRLETAKNTLLVNWGIAALVYLIAGKIVERFVRP